MWHTGGTSVVCSAGGSLPAVAGGAALIVPVGDVASLADALVAGTSDTARQEHMRIHGLARGRVHLGAGGLAAPGSVSSGGEKRRAWT
jgi:hypothetical protein